MENDKIQISRKLIALLVAGGISMAPIPGTAKTDNSYDPGTFVKKYAQQEEQYGRYIVKEKDNLSRISEKICSHLRMPISTEFWPAIAFLNGYPKVSQPGDVIIFPNSEEELINLNNELRKVGWTARYIQNNHIYKKVPKRKISIRSLGSLLYEIYGPDVCIDPDFMHLYLKVHNLEDHYILSEDDGLDDNALYELTEWIPTLEELEEYRKENQPKTKVKK